MACPGCYPTSILIPLLPVVRANLIRTVEYRCEQSERREWRRPESQTRICFLSNAMRALGPMVCPRIGIYLRLNRKLPTPPEKR